MKTNEKTVTDNDCSKRVSLESRKRISLVSSKLPLRCLTCCVNASNADLAGNLITLRCLKKKEREENSELYLWAPLRSGESRGFERI